MAIVSPHVNNHLKCKWTELSNQKEEQPDGLKTTCCLQETHLSYKDKQAQ